MSTVPGGELLQSFSFSFYLVCEKSSIAIRSRIVAVINGSKVNT